ncbi:MAG: hypothetical protein AAGE98_19235 [Actinomycetota bacterium]
MRFERLVIEADENTFSLDFHPRLTVISGVGRLEREGLISELVGSLSSSRAGVHAEVVADNGNRFAIFRPFGARARVIDVEASADVSARFADSDGAIDLLHVAGLDMRSAKRALRVTSTDLTTSTHHDQIVRRLAMTDPAVLWPAADRAKAAQAELDQAAADSGSAPEDAAVVARIEDQHQRFEEAQARAEKFRKISFIGGAVSALAAVPSAMFVNQLAAMAWVIVAAVVTAVSFVQHQRMERARKAENEALAAAGAESYLGFHLQRVNGLLDSEQARKKLMDASAEYDAAVADWKKIAGDIVPEWAYEYRDEIDTVAAQLANVSTFGTGPAEDTDDDVTALAHALMQRITKVRTVGPAGESLPLVLDDALEGLDADMKATLLELLVHSSDQQQIVFLTEDPHVTEWARVEAITGDLSILEPSGAGEPTVDVTDDAVNVA